MVYKLLVYSRVKYTERVFTDEQDRVNGKCYLLDLVLDSITFTKLILFT